MSSSPLKKQLIGRREYIRLPLLGGMRLEAKVDTGAYTSALHVSGLESFSRSGENMVRFALLDSSDESYTGEVHEIPVHKSKRIRSSNGLVQTRYLIQTTVQIGSFETTTFFSLSDRSAMTHPVLLGRKLISGNFLVDVSGTFLLSG